MSDKMRFSPDVLTIRAGETVRFVVRNNGNLVHEIVLGTRGRSRQARGGDAQEP